MPESRPPRKPGDHGGMPEHPINIALPLAGGWAVVGIIATVFMVATGRTGWLDKATRVFDEQAAAGAAEQSQTEA